MGAIVRAGFVKDLDDVILNGLLAQPNDCANVLAWLASCYQVEYRDLAIRQWVVHDWIGSRLFGPIRKFFQYRFSGAYQ